MGDNNLFQSFADVFTTNIYIYETNQSIKTIREKINTVIRQQEIFNFQYNLTGILRPDNSFKLTRRAGLGRIKSWDKEPVTINGTLAEIGPSLTRIEIEIKPNFIFVLFPALFGTIGLTAILIVLFTYNRELLPVCLFFLAVPVLWGIAHYSKSYYKSEFERALDLPANHVVAGRTIKL